MSQIAIRMGGSVDLHPLVGPGDAQEAIEGLADLLTRGACLDLELTNMQLSMGKDGVLIPDTEGRDYWMLRAHTYSAGKADQWYMVILKEFLAVYVMCAALTVSGSLPGRWRLESSRNNDRALAYMVDNAEEAIRKGAEDMKGAIEEFVALTMDMENVFDNEEVDNDPDASLEQAE